MCETSPGASGLLIAMKIMKLPLPFKRTLIALGCALLALSTSGCVLLAVGAAGAAGAGTVAYIRGELDTSLNGTVDTVGVATTKALEELRLAKIHENKSAVDAEIRARTGQDKRVDIRLNRAADNLTRVRIRVGTFGDEELSRLLLEKIKAKL